MLIYYISVFVTVGVLFLPVERISAHIEKTALGFEAHKFVSVIGAGVTGCDIARAARSDLVRYLFAVGFGESLYHIENAVAHARAEIDDFKTAVFEQFADRKNVTFGKIANVDIIADARSVGSRIVVAENVHAREFPYGDLRDIRTEIVGYSVRIFADKPRRMRSDGVEVPSELDSMHHTLSCTDSAFR